MSTESPDTTSAHTRNGVGCGDLVAEAWEAVEGSVDEKIAIELAGRAIDCA